MLLKNRVFLLLSVFFLASCSLFHEDMTSVDQYLSQGQYSEAIIELDDMKSSFAKKKNAQVHLDYAVNILKNIKEDKRTRYFTAKDILEKAVLLDPKNKEAQTYYLMVLKLTKDV
jgi:tetratricopeptide (TPR) repeat protein